MEDFNNKSWEDRIKDIKNNLYIGGGEVQANALLDIMMSPFGSKEFGYADINVSNILNSISRQIRELIRVVKDGGIVPIKIFESNFKGVHRQHDAYACLDKNLKFCVKHYGEEDWKDILYVFPYMNCMTAFDVSFKYDHIHQSDF
jgi:hypothetical protein